MAKHFEPAAPSVLKPIISRFKMKSSRAGQRLPPSRQLHHGRLRRHFKSEMFESHGRNLEPAANDD